MPRSRNHRAAATARLLVERPDLVALEVHPPADGADVVRGDDAGRLDPEVRVAVAVGHRLAGDLEHELVALGRDEAEPFDLALEELVRRDRRPVADRGDVPPRGTEHPEDLLDARDEPVGGVARRARRLRRDELTGVLVEGHDVGERPPGVDPDPDPSLSLLRHGHDSSPHRSRFRWQFVPTNPSASHQMSPQTAGGRHPNPSARPVGSEPPVTRQPGSDGRVAPCRESHPSVTSGRSAARAGRATCSFSCCAWCVLR